MAHQAIELDHCKMDRVTFQKDSRKLQHNYSCYKIYYGEQEGIPLVLRHMYINFKPRHGQELEPSSSSSIHEGFMLFRNPHTNEDFYSFLKKLQDKLQYKIPGNEIALEFKNKMKMEKASYSIRVYPDVSVIYKKNNQGGIRMVPSTEFTSVMGEGDLAVNLHRIHCKDTKVHLKFQLFYAMMSAETPLKQIENPFLSKEEAMATTSLLEDNQKTLDHEDSNE